MRPTYVPCPERAAPDEDPANVVYPCPSCGGQGVLLDVVQFLPPAQLRALRRWKVLLKRLRWRTRARALRAQNCQHWRMAGPELGVMEVWQHHYHRSRALLSGFFHSNALGLWGWLVWKRVVRIRMQQTRFSRMGHALRALKELVA